MPEPLPPIDYSSRDWVSLRTDLIAAKRQRMPEWTSESPNDFGIVMIELFAYVGDMLSFYADRIANEAFLDTAVLRSSIYSLARMLDYRPTGLGAATTTLQFTTPASAGSVTIPAGTRVQTVAAPGASPIVFETNIDLIIVGGGGSHTGTVAATQGRTITGEAVGASDGTLYQRYPLFNSPVIDATPVVSVTESGSTLQWVYFDHLIDAGPTDPAYSTYMDEGGVLWIEFGDDVNGRVPIAGAAITATYRVGDGAAGNVGSGTLTQLTGPVVVLGVTQPVSGVSNSGAATGGADPETLNSIRQNAPRALSAVNRAVTLNDYAALARRLTGVGKATATGTAGAVTVYVAPTNSPGSTVAATIKTNVQNYLEPRKMIGTTITMGDPLYIPVDVAAAINVLPTYRREVVRQAVLRAITLAFAWETVDFASRVTLSKIYAVINATEGVDYGNVTMLGAAPGTPGVAADVVMTATQIPQAGTITVTAAGGIV